MLIVTHEMRFALSIADEICFMEHGTILERGPPADLRLSPAFERTRQFAGRFAEL